MTSKKRSSKSISTEIGGPDQTSGDKIKPPGRDSRSGKGSEYMAGRRSLAYELSESGGLNSGRLGLEILFLLPDDFVDFYTTLFHRALDEGVGNRGSAGGGKDGKGGEGDDLRIAKGRTGTVLGSDNRLQAQGSGKRYRNTGLTIKNERALKVKGLVDKGLRELMVSGTKSLKRGISEESGLTPRSKGSIEDKPDNSGSSRTGGSVLPGTCRNGNCRSFVKDSWKFCPRCGNAL